MAYLFVHFTEADNGDRETIWFSVSKDGLHWIDLGGNEPIIKTELGTKGIRDPFIVYDEKLKKHFIIATDLNTSQGNWYDFSHNGSRSLFVWESADLINWSDERLIEIGIENAGCVWAPEAIYCKEKGAWFVFFASCVKENGEQHHKQRIYGTFTKDFKHFTPPFKFIDAETDVIDTNIVWDNGYYYRFSKDETNKKITIERSEMLVDGKWSEIHSEIFSSFCGLEGPEAYYLEAAKKWCLIADQYRTHKGYTPFICDDLSTGNFVQLQNEQYDMGKRKKRHGGVIKITDEQYEKLIENFGTDK